MKTCTPLQLREAYTALYPNESRPQDEAEQERILGNWLERYNRDPVDAIRTCNWYGKCTLALLKALGLPKPKSKRHCLFMLAGN